MKLRKLARLCIHDQLKPHGQYGWLTLPDGSKKKEWSCPGGVFLPDDTPTPVWWCEVHRSIGTETICDGAEIVRHYHEPESPCRIAERFLLDALSVREAE